MGKLRQSVHGLVNAVLRPFNLSMIHGSLDKSWTHPSAPGLTHRRVLPAATYSPWLDDRDFIRIRKAIQQNTLVDIYRCYELWLLGKQAAGIAGDFLEVGVWRGGTGCLLAECARQSGKRAFLADTFRGVVKAGVNDTRYSGGEHADTSERLVRDLAASLHLNNIHILTGIFPDDTGSQAPDRIALLHCDVDVYSSAKSVVEWALPRLSTGGVIVFDDYGFSGCEGVTRLANEMRSIPGLFFLHNLNGHAVFVKLT
jgi:O-methyltransferase